MKEKAESVGTFRWLEVFLMETLASWVPTTPEMEIKVLFGRHVWEAAQNADGLGKRAFELRAPLHYTLPPPREYEALFRELTSVAETSDRIAVFYDAVLPALARRYSDYLAATDHLLDEPTVRVMERILDANQRMLAERETWRKDLPLAAPNQSLVKSWTQREGALPGIVAHGEGAALARAVPA
ncbi:MAG: hypothetical protein M3O85_08465 [Acidobacteriota bacterium]|nr:hypothetical protein [Acidobacteriota bacterium]